MNRRASLQSTTSVVSQRRLRNALGRLLLVVAVLAAVLVTAAPRPASAAGGSISITTYKASLVCHDDVCTQTSAPVKYMRVLGTGFTHNGPVFVEIIRLSDFTVADTYAAVYSGRILVVNTAINYCPPHTSTHLFLVRALDLTTLTYSNSAPGSVCPGQGSL